MADELELRQRKAELLLFLQTCGCYCRAEQRAARGQLEIIFPEYICTRHSSLKDVKRRLGE